jgi:hypothetical protein
MRLPLSLPGSVGQEWRALRRRYLARVGAMNLLRDEVQVLQLTTEHPQHPDIIKSHGYRVRRGFVPAIVLALDKLSDWLDNSTRESIM